MKKEQKKNEMVGRITELAEKRKKKEVVQLPLCFEDFRATPNSFIRSALFSAVQSKDRVQMKQVVLESQNGITVNYTGEQLNQEDLTVWQALVNLAKIEPLGNSCTFSAHSLLKAMDTSTGGDQHTQLDNAIRRLNACSVEITHDNKVYFGNLVVSGVKNKLTKFYSIRLNPDLIRLFGDSQWTAIDWQQRLVLRRKPLSQALHAYYSSHKTPVDVTISFLQKLTGSRNKDNASFKRQCRQALENLVAIGFLQEFRFKRDLVCVKRAFPSLEQPRR